jgi:hypothetical protein
MSLPEQLSPAGYTGWAFHGVSVLPDKSADSAALWSWPEVERFGGIHPWRWRSSQKVSNPQVIHRLREHVENLPSPSPAAAWLWGVSRSKQEEHAPPYAWIYVSAMLPKHHGIDGAVTSRS